METEKGLESLKVWKDSIQLAVGICKEVLPLFPQEEKYSLSSQLRRSCQSISSNIAEGYGRYYFQDNIHFCYIARGSLDEVFSQLTLASELGYIDSDLYQKFINSAENIRRMLNGYILHLKSKKPGAAEPGALIRETGPDYQLDYSDPDSITGHP